MTRWSLVVTLVVCLLVAGCSGGGESDDTLVASGSPAAVDAEALDATGYESAGETNRMLNTTVEATITGDVEMQAEQKVSATTPITTYRRASDAGLSLFIVVTAPAVRPIENQPVVRNPLTVVETTRLVQHVQSTYTVDSLQEQDNSTVTMLDNETHAVTSHGTATREGTSVPVAVTVTSVRDGDEFVTAIGITPQSMADREQFQRLLSGVTH